MKWLALFLPVALFAQTRIVNISFYPCTMPESLYREATQTEVMSDVWCIDATNCIQITFTNSPGVTQFCVESCPTLREDWRTPWCANSDWLPASLTNQCTQGIVSEQRFYRIRTR